MNFNCAVYGNCSFVAYFIIWYRDALYLREMCVFIEMSIVPHVSTIHLPLCGGNHR